MATNHINGRTEDSSRSLFSGRRHIEILAKSLTDEAQLISNINILGLVHMAYKFSFSICSFNSLSNGLVGYYKILQRIEIDEEGSNYAVDRGYLGFLE